MKRDIGRGKASARLWLFHGSEATGAGASKLSGRAIPEEARERELGPDWAES